MHPPKIAACLITKDSAETIERAIDSIRPFVDEICVYDTGSTDETVELLEGLNDDVLYISPEGVFRRPIEMSSEDLESGFQTVPLAPIRVERGEWRGDFAWAREQSYAMVSDDVEWTLWLDDDDEVVGAQHFRMLAAQAPPDLDGYIFMYDYARDEHGQCVCQLWRERLMRRSAGYRWLNPVHEVQVPPDRPAVLANIPPEQVRYVHHRPPERGIADPDRNLRILVAQRSEALESGELPGPRTLAYIGTELMAKGDLAPAIPYLEEYLRHPEAGWSDERSQVYHKLAACLRAIGNPQAAVEAEMQALRERDDWAETYVGLSLSFAMLGQWDRAVREAKRGLDLGVPQTPLIVNPLEFTLLPLLTIAEGCVHLNRPDEAQAALERALALSPGNTYAQAKAAELRALLAQNEILGAVLLLRETLVRHDENLKAYVLLEQAVPYVIAERPELVKARADQREMVAHYLRPKEYDRWYREEPKESTVEDDFVPEIGEYIPRAKRLLEGLREQEASLGRKPRLIDLGANDMWLACYLWCQAEYVVDGIELNRQSVEKGLARMERFGAPGKLHHGNIAEASALLNGARYDAVSLFEVIEHVPDVEAALDICEGLLAPGGIVYVSTPNGAYERGAINAWARVERKGHLRAIPVHDLIDTFSRRGEVEFSELQHDDRVTFASYRPKPRKGRVTFYAGAGWEPWSPASINQGGLGGSETALVQVATRLAGAGYQVTVYSGSEPGFFAGALYRPFTAWDPTDEPDLLVVSRLCHVFDNPIGAKRSALWCHDHSYPGQLTEARAEKIDSIVVLSRWQQHRFARLYPFAASKLKLIRNGITVRGPDGEDRHPDAKRPFAERAPRVVYSSSADRGLDVLLELWPQIRAEVPEAELHVFYGWQVFDRVAMTNPALLAYKARVLELVEQAGAEEGGVFMRGRVGQRELAAEMMDARVWGYPTNFLETSCIGAMEARAAGLAIVTSDLGALAETVGEHGYLVPWEADEDEPHNASAGYREMFVKRVVAALTDERGWLELHRAARRGVASLDWNTRVAAWEKLMAPPAAAKKRRRAKLAA